MSGKRKSPEEVELNLAAMLDMAFQILTFFVLTFKPAPVEGQIALRMPPPQPLAIQAGKAQAGSTEENKDPVAGFNTLAIWLDAGDDGHIEKLAVGAITANSNQRQDISVDRDLTLLNTTLAGMLNDPGSPFDQVVIQVGDKLRYDELMKVIGICTKQTVGGDPKNKLSKLSLVSEGNPTPPPKQ
jgi:biopolymer transport protein ExbD